MKVTSGLMLVTLSFLVDGVMALPVTESSSELVNATLSSLALPENYTVEQSDQMGERSVVTIEEGCTAYNGYSSDQSYWQARPAMMAGDKAATLSTNADKGYYTLVETDTQCRYGLGKFEPDTHKRRIKNRQLRNSAITLSKLQVDPPSSYTVYFRNSGTDLQSEVMPTPDLPAGSHTMSMEPVQLMGEDSLISSAFFDAGKKGAVEECPGFTCTSIDLYTKVDDQWGVKHLFYSDDNVDISRAGNYLIYETFNNNNKDNIIHVLQPPYTSETTIKDTTGEGYSLYSAFMDQGDLKLLMSNLDKQCLQIISASAGDIKGYQCDYRFKSYEATSTSADLPDYIRPVHKGDGQIGLVISWQGDIISWPGPYKDQMVAKGEESVFLGDAFPVLKQHFKGTGSTVRVTAVETFSSYQGGQKIRLGIRAPSETGASVEVPYLLEYENW